MQAVLVQIAMHVKVFYGTCYKRFLLVQPHDTFSDCLLPYPGHEKQGSCDHITHSNSITSLFFHGFTPADTTKPHTASLSLCPGGTWKRIERIRKFMGRDKDNLIGKEKAVHTGTAKQGIHSFPSASRYSAIPTKARLCHTLMMT